MKLFSLPSLAWWPLTVLLLFFLGVGLITGRFWGESDFLKLQAQQNRQSYLETFFRQAIATDNLSEPLSATDLPLTDNEQFFLASSSGRLEPSLLVFSQTTKRPTNILLKGEYYRWLTEAELARLKD